MKILELHKISLAALLLSLLALVMLSGCSTTEETPPPAESGGDTSTYVDALRHAEISTARKRVSRMFPSDCADL